MTLRAGICEPINEAVVTSSARHAGCKEDSSDILHNVPIVAKTPSMAKSLFSRARNRNAMMNSESESQGGKESSKILPAATNESLIKKTAISTSSSFAVRPKEIYGL